MQNQDLDYNFQQRINRLISHAKNVLIVSQLVAIGLFFVIYQSSDPTAAMYWMSSLTLITILRFAYLFYWQQQKNIHQKKWLYLYILAAAIAGLNWSSVILLFSPEWPYQIQFILLIVLIGLPVASIPANAIFLRVYMAFSFPIVLVTFWMTISNVPDYIIEFVIISLAYTIVLINTAYLHRKYLVQSIDSQRENEILIQKLSESNQQLEQLAYKDPLTGLANRRGFHAETQKAVQKHQQNDNFSAVIIIDIDNFKTVNDTMGHESGDQLLSAIAARLNCTLHDNDILIQGSTSVARYGGDEFVIMLNNIQNPDQIPLIGQNLLHAINEPMSLSCCTYVPEASIGISFTSNYQHTLDELMKFADEAMYEAKHKGKNNVAVYQGELEINLA